MASNAVEAMVDLWMADDAFREELRTDPEGTVSRHGFDLTGEELAALRSLDLSQPDEELARRASFGG